MLKVKREGMEQYVLNEEQKERLRELYTRLHPPRGPGSNEEQAIDLEAEAEAAAEGALAPEGLQPWPMGTDPGLRERARRQLSSLSDEVMVATVLEEGVDASYDYMMKVPLRKGLDGAFIVNGQTLSLDWSAPHWQGMQGMTSSAKRKWPASKCQTHRKTHRGG